jgi:sodium-dependent dicarboxylate transporter 2/3/5
LDKTNEDVEEEYKKIKGKNPVLSRRNIFFIIAAILVIVLFYFLPTPDGLSSNGKMMIGILFMGAILWIAEPIPLAVTGLLIMIIQPIMGILPAGEVFSSFGNQAVFFLIGAFILAGALEKHGLHKRIALKFLSFFEKNPKMFTFGIMLSCAFLSFIMPEHGVAAMFLPLIGGARNPLTVGMLADLEQPIAVSFFDWMTYSMPIVFISLPIVWVILQISFPIKVKNIAAAKTEINRQVSRSGRMGRYEITVMCIMILTVFLWIFVSSPGYFSLAVIAILGSILLFFTGSITWKDVEQRVPWGLVLLYGGAITLGVGMQKTGAGAWIAHQLFAVAGDNPYLVILGLIILTVLLTNIMSNVGAVAILLPIGVAISTEIPGISPLLASMLIALSGGLAFMFVIATPGNAIAYSSGYFSSRHLLRAGVVANIACIGVIFLVAVIYWKGVLGL